MNLIRAAAIFSFKACAILGTLETCAVAQENARPQTTPKKPQTNSSSAKPLPPETSATPAQSKSSYSKYNVFFATAEGGYTFAAMQNPSFPRKIALQGGEAVATLGYAYALWPRLRISAASYSSYAYLSNRTEGNSDGTSATSVKTFQSFSTGASLGIEYIWRGTHTKLNSFCTLGLLNFWDEKTSGTSNGLSAIGKFDVDMSAFLQYGGKISFEQRITNSILVGTYASVSAGMLGSSENTTETMTANIGLKSSYSF